ncbi:MAG TPA: hypothetical protein VKE41_00135 [Roseiflexaceae bacterium]|nr:hypothetical protein [Roseiflexaceae bacterium]
MHSTDRRAALIAILLGALTMLFLSACGKPDDAAMARQLTGAMPTAGSAAPATGSAGSSTATSTSTPSGDATAAPLAASPTSTPAPEPTALGTTTLTQTLATPSPLADDETDPFTNTDDLTDTDDITVTVQVTTTGTLTVTHPVAVAIADYFTVPVLEVITLHADGLGFGEIARAYFLARELAADGDTSNDLTATQILAMHQGGMGWGQIVVSLGLPHGNSGRNLGLIMRNHTEHSGPTVVVADGSELDEHGPPSVPPGQLKDKGKDKQHGNGHGHGAGNGKGNGNGGGKKGK